VTKADADSPAVVSHLNRCIHLGIRLSVPRVESMPFAQVLHLTNRDAQKDSLAEARLEV
jgi:hypothetical protein